MREHGASSAPAVAIGLDLRRVLRHAVIPAIPSLLFLVIASVPVEVFGCRNRGLLAVAIALTATLAAVVTTAVGTGARRRGNPEAPWWLLSTLILLIPAILLILLA